MSGIVGIINLDGAPVDRDLLAQMTSYMIFRGPDHQDLWLNGNVGFGHTLLRTTFESEQEHGVTTLDGQVWITADVRLDGRQALIDKLCAKGAQGAATATDVELVLHAYELWGEAALDHLMGDFAFGLWDGRRRRLFCAHDHFGVVPFYYAQVQNCLLFSNTLNVLRLHPAVTDTLNEQAIGDFLLFMMNMDLATTTFADIQRLPPAHSLVCADSSAFTQRYFQLRAEGDPIHYKQQAAYVEHFRERLDEAVADRLRTNAVGAHLSGGMDSTSIVATAHQWLQGTGKSFDLRTCTAVYEQLVVDDEGHYAGMVAEALHLPIEYFATDRYFQQLPVDQPPYLLPEPGFIPSQSVECAMSAHIADFSRVLLAGFGGDPAFNVNSTDLGKLSPRERFGFIGKKIWWATRHRQLPRFGLRTYLKHREPPVTPTTTFPSWLQHDFVERTALQEQWEGITTQVRTQRGRAGMLTAPLWANIFAASDPGFTALPLRVRYPFFDLRLVRYLQSIASTPWLQNKQLLRQVMCDRLPQPILQRAKTPIRGYPRHIYAQQRGRQAWMHDLLALPAMTTYVDCKQCLQLVQATESLTPAASDQLSFVFSLAYWLRHRRDQIYPERSDRHGANSFSAAVHS